MSWCFAILNDKLAEIFFNKTKNGVRIHSHCYVNKSEYTDESELKALESDIKKVKVLYKNNKYTLL